MTEPLLGPTCKSWTPPQPNCETPFPLPDPLSSCSQPPPIESAAAPLRWILVKPWSSPAHLVTRAPASVREACSSYCPGGEQGQEDDCKATLQGSRGCVGTKQQGGPGVPWRCPLGFLAPLEGQEAAQQSHCAHSHCTHWHCAYGFLWLRELLPAV